MRWRRYVSARPSNASTPVAIATPVESLRLTPPSTMKNASMARTIRSAIQNDCVSLLMPTKRSGRLQADGAGRVARAGGRAQRRGERRGVVHLELEPAPGRPVHAVALAV